MGISEQFRTAVAAQHVPVAPAPAAARKRTFWLTGTVVVLTLAMGGGIVGGIIAALIGEGLSAVIRGLRSKP
jgi:hypothetical protein